MSISTPGAVEGFRPNLNYHREKGLKREKLFPWKSLPLGRVALVEIAISGDSLNTGGLALDRKFAARGITPEFLYQALLKRMPFFSDYHAEEVGYELTPEKTMQRYHKMFYSPRASRQLRGQLGEEHPTRHPALRPLLGPLSQLRVTARSLSRETCERLAAEYPPLPRK